MPRVPDGNGRYALMSSSRRKRRSACGIISTVAVMVSLTDAIWNGAAVGDWGARGDVGKTVGALPDHATGTRRVTLRVRDVSNGHPPGNHESTHGRPGRGRSEARRRQARTNSANIETEMAFITVCDSE